MTGKTIIVGNMNYNFFLHYRRLIKPSIFFITVLFALALLSGCAGMVADSIARSIATDKTYGEMATTLPPLTDGNGRLYIYRTAASTKSSLYYGIGIMKNPTLCTIDDTAYEIIYEVFKYFDLPMGQHEITCGLDVLKKSDRWSGKQYYQKGANKVQISIVNGAETFVRVDLVESKPAFQPLIVDNEQGRTEIVNLPYQKKEHTFLGGKISEQ